MTVQNLIPKSLCNAMFIEKQYRHQFASSRTKCTLNRYRGVLCGNRKPNIQGTERHSRIFTKISSEKALFFLNKDDILCILYVLQQRLRHVRRTLHDNHASIYHHEILYQAHEDFGHQCVVKVLVTIQEKQSWP